MTASRSASPFGLVLFVLLVLGLVIGGFTLPGWILWTHGDPRLGMPDAAPALRLALHAPSLLMAPAGTAFIAWQAWRIGSAEGARFKGPAIAAWFGAGLLVGLAVARFYLHTL